MSADEPTVNADASSTTTAKVPPPLGLAVSGLALSYGGVKALRGISMQARPGEITCIMGRNGVGKTSLVRAIMGQLPIDAGTISLGGGDITRLPAFRRARAGVALVPQGREIFARLSVEQNLQVGLAARSDGLGIPHHVHELFPILRTMARRMGGDLSGGQQQQLAIARALVGAPRVLLLDEPTEGIQPNIIQQIGAVLRALVRAHGMTIVLVEQYLDFVKEFAQHFYILDRGQVVAEGAIDTLHQSLISSHLSV